MIVKNLRKRIFTSLILLSLVFLIYSFNYILIFSLIVLGVISIIEFISMIKKIFKSKVYFSLMCIFFTCYIFIFCLMFFLFSSFFQLKILLFIFLLGCVASDIGGYVVGKIFKGPKLIKISPNKTVSGSIGSIIFTTIIISGLIFYFNKNLNIGIIITSILTSISCQIGDLFFSFLKRKAKIKDTGNFLPGHGGVLDRIDGILFAIPTAFLSLIFLIK